MSRRSVTGVLADARHREQLLLVCLQHGGKRAEPLEKRVSHAVRIAPGRGIKEQQLQGVYVVEVFETVAAEAFLHPRAVAVVDAHFPRPLRFILSDLLFERHRCVGVELRPAVCPARNS